MPEAGFGGSCPALNGASPSARPSLGRPGSGIKEELLDVGFKRSSGACMVGESARQALARRFGEGPFQT